MEFSLVIEGSWPGNDLLRNQTIQGLCKCNFRVTIHNYFCSLSTRVGSLGSPVVVKLETPSCLCFFGLCSRMSVLPYLMGLVVLPQLESQGCLPSHKSGSFTVPESLKNLNYRKNAFLLLTVVILKTNLLASNLSVWHHCYKGFQYTPFLHKCKFKAAIYTLYQNSTCFLEGEIL